jgi:sulfopyruvate decarboxylase subunit alpha
MESMPVSVTNSKLIYDALKACDVKIMSALPETWLVHLIRMADEDPDTTLIRIAKEEEAVGISAGAHLAGVNSALLMQNHGFLAAINPIVSLALLYKIPLLMLTSSELSVISVLLPLSSSQPVRCSSQPTPARAPCLGSP